MKIRKVSRAYVICGWLTSPARNITSSLTSFTGTRRPGQQKLFTSGLKMAEDAIAKAGLYFDELHKIRVLDPEIATQTGELKDECKDFLDKMTEFQKIVGGFVQHIDTIAKEVEKEKLKAIASRNQLKSISKQRESQQQQLQALILEKKMQLERLRIQHEALLKEEREQTEFVEQLILQK